MRLEKERIWLEKENDRHKNLPGFTLDILSEGEREALRKEISDLRDQNYELKKANTLLSESEEIKKGIENISTMFLHKSDDLLS